MYQIVEIGGREVSGAETTALLALAEATDGMLYDANYEGGEWMTEAVRTHETLENFIEASATWAECSSDRRGTIAGYPFIAWRAMQAGKGHPRQALSVIDLGDVRFALPGTDLSNY